MNREANRAAVVKLFEPGTPPANICELLRLSKSTVYDVIKRYKELGTMTDRPRSGRPITATTPANLNKLRCRIRRNPGKSMNKLAKELKISRRSVAKMVKNKLKLRSYKLGMGNYLDERMKRVRLENAQRLLKKKSF